MDRCFSATRRRKRKNKAEFFVIRQNVQHRNEDVAASVSIDPYRHFTRQNSPVIVALNGSTDIASVIETASFLSERKIKTILVRVGRIQKKTRHWHCPSQKRVFGLFTKECLSMCKNKITNGLGSVLRCNEIGLTWNQFVLIVAILQPIEREELQFWMRFRYLKRDICLIPSKSECRRGFLPSRNVSSTAGW